MILQKVKVKTDMADTIHLNGAENIFPPYLSDLIYIKPTIYCVPQVLLSFQTTLSDFIVSPWFLPLRLD